MKAKSNLHFVLDAVRNKYLYACTTALMAQQAHAADFGVDGFKELGCDVIAWMMGDLATIIFFIVVILTIVVGFFAKMDWSKILSIIILMGILKGVPTMLEGTTAFSTTCPDATATTGT